MRAELNADPPKKPKRRSVLDHPRIQEWLDQLLALRAQGHKISSAYIAAKLQKGATIEKLLGPDEVITETNVRRYLWARSVDQKV